MRHKQFDTTMRYIRKGQIFKQNAATERGAGERRGGKLEAAIRSFERVFILVGAMMRNYAASAQKLRARSTVRGVGSTGKRAREVQYHFFNCTLASLTTEHCRMILCEFDKSTRRSTG